MFSLLFRKHQTYLMERWLDFTEVYSLPVLSNLPWNSKCAEEMKVKETFESMWTLLRHAVLYFMRYEDCQHTEDAIVAAQRCLLQYGALAEKVRAVLTCIGRVYRRLYLYPTLVRA